jgi:RNA polymerase sigma factor (sigma-70 family)
MTYNTISREDEIELLAKAKTGDTEAVQDVIDNYTTVVQKVISKYVGFQYEDLLSPGIWGLIEAIKTFDLSRGYRFATYAPCRIRRRVNQFMYQERNLPENYLTRVRFLERTGHMTLMIHYMNLPDFDNFLQDRTVPDPETVMMMREERRGLSHKIQRHLDCLKDRERDIIIRHVMQEEVILQDLAEEYGVSRQRVNQIEQKALEKLSIHLGNNERFIKIIKKEKK